MEIWTDMLFRNKLIVCLAIHDNFIAVDVPKILLALLLRIHHFLLPVRVLNFGNVDEYDGCKFFLLSCLDGILQRILFYQSSRTTWWHKEKICVIILEGWKTVEAAQYSLTDVDGKYVAWILYYRSIMD